MGFNCNNFYYFYWNTNVSYWNKTYSLLEKNYMNLYLIYRKNCNFLPDSLFIALFNLRGLASLSHAYFWKKMKNKTNWNYVTFFAFFLRNLCCLELQPWKTSGFPKFYVQGFFLSRLKEKTVNTSVMNVKYRQSAFEKCC